MRARRLVAVAWSASWLLTSAGSAFALDPTRRITEYTIRAWGETAGLPQATVRALAQTRDGYLWIATETELSRFDGVTFKIYDAQSTPTLDAQVRTLLVDGAGDLWVGLMEGSTLLRYRERRFERMDRALGFPSGHAVLSSFQDRAGRLWFGSWTGVAAREPGGYRRLRMPEALPRAEVWAIEQTADGAIWFGTYAGLGRLEPNGQRIEPVPLPPSSPIVRALAAEPGGGLWVGTDSDLFLRRPDGGWQRFGVNEGLPRAGVTTLLRDSHGSLWIGTTAGLARRLRSGDGFEVLTSPELPDGWIRSLFEDREGNLWLGTRSAGAVQLANAKFGRLTRADGLPSERAASVFVGRDGTLWIGTSGDGLIRYREGRARQYTEREGLCTDFVYGLAEDQQGRLWVAGGQSAGANVCALELKTNRWRSYSRDDGSRVELARVVHADAAGAVWVGADRLLRLDGDRLIAEAPVPGASGNQFVYSLLVDHRGALWQGALGLVARRAPGGAWHRADAATDGLVPPIRALYEDERGSVWIGTGRGVARWREGRVARIGRAAGLVDEPVVSIAEQRSDAGQELWLGTAHGLVRVSKDEADAVADGKRAAVTMIRYGVLDGMRTARCEGSEGGATVARDSEGRLWFPTARGLVSVEPRRIKTNPVLPSVWIEDMSADGRAIASGGVGVVPAGTRALRISYTAPLLTLPEKVAFKYRLDPFDGDWVAAGPRREAFYTNVPGGRYTFRVLASNEEGAWGQEGAAVTLNVAPRAHETWWFRLGALAAVASLLVGAHRLRLARLRARHELVMAERTRIARDVHDTLAQGFTGISLQLEVVAGGLASAPERVRTSLDKARVLVRMSLAEARRAVWDLRQPGLGDSGDLRGALTQLAREVGGQTPVHLSVAGTVRRLPAGPEKALLRIAQEALTNATRHARASAIDVTLTYGSGEVELRVKDDGCGFDAGDPGASAAGHFGLLGMKERAQNLDGSVDVLSRVGEGTEVIARLPTSGAP